MPDKATITAELDRIQARWEHNQALGVVTPFRTGPVADRDSESGHGPAPLQALADIRALVDQLP